MSFPSDEAIQAACGWPRGSESFAVAEVIMRKGFAIDEQSIREDERQKNRDYEIAFIRRCEKAQENARADARNKLLSSLVATKPAGEMAEELIRADERKKVFEELAAAFGPPDEGLESEDVALFAMETIARMRDEFLAEIKHFILRCNDMYHWNEWMVKQLHREFGKVIE